MKEMGGEEEEKEKEKEEWGSLLQMKASQDDLLMLPHEKMS